LKGRTGRKGVLAPPPPQNSVGEGKQSGGRVTRYGRKGAKGKKGIGGSSYLGPRDKRPHKDQKLKGTIGTSELRMLKGKNRRLDESTLT